MTLPNVVAAIAATAGLLSARPRHAGNPGARRHAARRRDVGGLARARAVDAIAFVLPRVDAATRTEWLVYDAPPSEQALAALALYVILLAAAGLFDFQRREA